MYHSIELTHIRCLPSLIPLHTTLELTKVLSIFPEGIETSQPNLLHILPTQANIFRPVTLCVCHSLVHTCIQAN